MAPASHRPYTTADTPVDSARFLRLGPIPRAAFEHRRQVDDHLVSVGVLIGGYHGHRGPTVARSPLVPWRGMELRAPAPEDMLVIVAARVVRKRQFAFVNFNDATMIVGTAREGIFMPDTGHRTTVRVSATSTASR